MLLSHPSESLTIARSFAATIWAAGGVIVPPTQSSDFCLGGDMGRRSAAKTMAKPCCSTRASSGSASGPSTPSTPTRIERVGKYEMGSLAKTWDNDELICDQIREKKPLLLHVDPASGNLVEQYVEGNVANVKANLRVLIPLADIMAKNRLLMPNIDRLIQVIDRLYQISKKPRSLEHCYQTAWAFRRLLGTGKSFCYKPAPPEEPKLKI